MQALLFLAALAAASAVDCRKRVIPNSLCFLTAAAGLISFSPVQLLGPLASLPLLIAALIQPECMGGGDIKLTAAAGFVLGFWRGFWGWRWGCCWQCCISASLGSFTRSPAAPTTQQAGRPCRLAPFYPLALPYYTALEVCNMKKFHVTKKTVLTIAGVTLPLAAAAILLPRLKRGRRARSVRA